MEKMYFVYKMGYDEYSKFECYEEIQFFFEFYYMNRGFREYLDN